MSILGSYTGTMSTPIFHELKNQVSFFLKEKIKTARLVLTDVTPVQLLVEEATNGNPQVPEARMLKMVSRAAFEVDDYWRIVDILHKRLLSFDRRNWRVAYNTLIILENLLTHGPERVAEEFQCDRDVIAQMKAFQYVDDKGFNWGVTMGKKSERILKLLERGPLLKQERDRARRISREIKGFGSFNGIGFRREQDVKVFGRCSSDFLVHEKESSNSMAPARREKNEMVDSDENFDPRLESADKPLLNEKKIEAGDHHPFVDSEQDVAKVSLLLSTSGGDGLITNPGWKWYPSIHPHLVVLLSVHLSMIDHKFSL